jgi:hypothetical protein
LPTWQRPFVFFNSEWDNPPTNTTLRNLFNIVDGVLNEGGCALQRQTDSSSCQSYAFDGVYNCNCAGNLAGPQSLWSDQGGKHGYMRLIQSRGKAYYRKNYFNYPQSHPGAPDPAGTEWSLASYLLARGHAQKAGAAEALYVTGNPDDEALIPLPAHLSVAIGHPCGDIMPTTSSNVYTRIYSNGFVAANVGGYTTTPPPAVTMPGVFQYFRWNGSGYTAAVAPPVALPYQTGLVLYSPSKLCN